MAFSSDRRAEPTPLRTRFIFAIGRPLCWWFMRLVYRLRIDGGQRVPATGRLIIAANHQSHYDPILVGLAVWNRLFRPMARSGLFQHKAVAFLLWLFNVISVDQESRRGDVAAIRAAITEVQSGRALVLFPEGGRSTDGVTHPLERGLMVVWRRTQATVTPIAMEGVYDIWPRHRSFPRLHGRIAIRIGDPITYAAIADRADEEVLAELGRWMEQKRLELRAEIRERSKGKYPIERDGDRGFED